MATAGLAVSVALCPLALACVEVEAVKSWWCLNGVGWGGWRQRISVSSRRCSPSLNISLTLAADCVDLRPGDHHGPGERRGPEQALHHPWPLHLRRRPDRTPAGLHACVHVRGLAPGSVRDSKQWWWWWWLQNSTVLWWLRKKGGGDVCWHSKWTGKEDHHHRASAICSHLLSAARTPDPRWQVPALDNGRTLDGVIATGATTDCALCEFIVNEVEKFLTANHVRGNWVGRSVG